MYYVGEPYESVLQQFKALIGEPEFFVRLTGAQGCGKSALLKQVTQYYTEQGYLTRCLAQNPDSPLRLRSMVRQSFGWQKTHNFQRDLQEYLISAARNHKGIILVFDDCHLMSNATLLEVTKLTDIQINHRSLLSIIMSGSDLLDSRLKRDPELRPVLQCTSLSMELPAMGKRASAQFVRQFFDAADQRELVFDASALALLHGVSKGLPQRITDIVSHCSRLHRSQELSSNVSKSDLARVLKQPSLKVRKQTPVSKPGPSRRHVAALAGITALALLGTAWITLRPTATAPVVETVVATVVEPAVEPVVEPAVEPAAEPVVEPVVETQAEPALLAGQASEQAVVSEPLPSSPEQTMQDWIAAWQAGDVNAYFGVYHAEFIPRGFDSLSAWQENRRLNIADREGIELQISDVSITRISEQTTQLEFWLAYQSPGYRDRTQKQILMRLGDQGWQIIQEINLDIIY